MHILFEAHRSQNVGSWLTLYTQSACTLRAMLFQCFVYSTGMQAHLRLFFAQTGLSQGRAHNLVLRPVLPECQKRAKYVSDHPAHLRVPNLQAGAAQARSNGGRSVPTASREQPKQSAPITSAVAARQVTCVQTRLPCGKQGGVITSIPCIPCISCTSHLCANLSILQEPKSVHSMYIFQIMHIMHIMLLEASCS